MGDPLPGLDIASPVPAARAGSVGFLAGGILNRLAGR